ncbi:MAG: NUDIX domain-containing protein [Desulfoplanes sp.]|nr:NUDIX domain-containing protein [Desulfoplanes sp.]
MNFPSTKARQSAPKTLVEVMDAKNTLLGVMPLPEVRRQRLFYRVAVVLIYNQENKLCLRKRKDTRMASPGRWDISIRTHLQIGEGSLDAACRKIREHLGEFRTMPVFGYTIQPTVETEDSFINIYTLKRFEMQPYCTTSEETLFVDRDELSGLLEHCPEHVTPLLVYLWNQDMLFVRR